MRRSASEREETWRSNNRAAASGARGAGRMRHVGLSAVKAEPAERRQFQCRRGDVKAEIQTQEVQLEPLGGGGQDPVAASGPTPSVTTNIRTPATPYSEIWKPDPLGAAANNAPPGRKSLPTALDGRSRPSSGTSRAM